MAIWVQRQEELPSGGKGDGLPFTKAGASGAAGVITARTSR
ncbi:MAG: hypothetical protein OEU26_01190 [Candidatus Tectomicrobia bacterium]|nr:hypothetical protein [Candidatus Tectomicrobia bacterium]